MAEAPSTVRQNYDWECEDAVNTHIQLCLYTSYMYMSMAVYFDRDKVVQEYFKQFFLTKSHNCQTSAEMFMHVQNKLGGCISLQDIKRPERESWHSCFQAMECAIQMDMMINQSLLNMHELAQEKGDHLLCHFLEQNCLDQQIDLLQEMSTCLSNLRKMGPMVHNLAECIFDKLSLS